MRVAKNEKDENKNTIFAVTRVALRVSLLISLSKKRLLMSTPSKIKLTANSENINGKMANRRVLRKKRVTVLPESLAKQSTDTCTRCTVGKPHKTQTHRSCKELGCEGITKRC